jgi:hypothetical protein
MAYVMVPLLKPSAPQQLTAVQATAGSTNVTLAWQVPGNLGGAPAVSSYQIDRSFDGGVTWSSYTSTTATRVVLTGPAKGTSATYRVTARTGYGLGEAAVSNVVTSAATAPSMPNGLSATLTTDGTARVNLSWGTPSDGGGSPMVGYRVESYVSSATGWVLVATTDATTRTASAPFGNPGTYLSFRVFAINQVGASTQAYSTSVRMPYVAPSASGNPVITNASNSTTTAPRILVTWTASSNLGGASLRYYALQSSTDGITWTTLTNTTATNWYSVKPATGTSLQYRVVVVTSSGLSAVSGVTAVTH